MVGLGDAALATIALSFVGTGALWLGVHALATPPKPYRQTPLLALSGALVSGLILLGLNDPSAALMFVFLVWPLSCLPISRLSRHRALLLGMFAGAAAAATSFLVLVRVGAWSA